MKQQATDFDFRVISRRIIWNHQEQNILSNSQRLLFNKRRKKNELNTFNTHVSLE